MHGVLFGTLVLVLILVLVFRICGKSKKNVRCKCGGLHCPECRLIHIQSFHNEFEENSPTSRGLNEIEQTTRSRGYIPEVNQPNHTANLWKCDQSHPQLKNDGQRDTVFDSDYPTPLRGSMVNMNVYDVSDMHLLSRFGSINSI